MSVKSVVPFSFEGSEVRVTEGPDGKPWYCAKDVCGILEYANSRNAIAEHCREEGVGKSYAPTAGGPQELTFISESNLYRLVCRSTLPAAVKFEKWVFEVLLPAVRHGVVSAPPPDVMPQITGKYIAVLERNDSDKSAEIARLRKEIRRLMAATPCVEEEVDTFMLLRNMGYSIGRIARATKRSRHTIRRHLRDDDLPDIDKQIEEMTE
jgi:prophage antirepressor-like protein